MELWNISMKIYILLFQKHTTTLILLRFETHHWKCTLSWQKYCTRRTSLLTTALIPVSSNATQGFTQRTQRITCRFPAMSLATSCFGCVKLEHVLFLFRGVFWTLRCVRKPCVKPCVAYEPGLKQTLQLIYSFTFITLFNNTWIQKNVP